MASVCPKCGEQNRDGAAFCGMCKEVLRKPRAAAAPPATATPEPETPEQTAARVAEALQRNGLPSEYSFASVVELDLALTERWGAAPRGIAPTTDDLMLVASYGAYVGECARRRCGGEWLREATPVDTPAPLRVVLRLPQVTLRPLAVPAQRLRDGERASLFGGLLELLSVAQMAELAAKTGLRFDFTPRSLDDVDALLDQHWGAAGKAAGDPRAMPSDTELAVIATFGMYVGETIRRALRGRWRPDADPEATVAARVEHAGGELVPGRHVFQRWREGAARRVAALRDGLLPAVARVEAPEHRRREPVAAPRPTPEQEATTAPWLARAAVLANLGKHGEALVFLRKAVDAAPGSRAAWRALADALHATRHHDDALDAFDQALVLGPPTGELLRARARCAGLLHRYDEALADVDRALALEPRSAVALCDRGVLLLGAQRNEDALLAFSQALELDARHAVSRYGKAMAEDLLGRAAEARVTFQQFLAYAPPALADKIAHARARIAALS